MKEKIEEILDGFKDRLKSSFLITFIPIWLLHHWRLVIILFNFDPYYYLDSKIWKIENYLESEKIYGLWIIPVVWTILSMLAYYTFSSLSELLNIIYNNLRKIIYERFDHKKLKLKSEYDELENKYRILASANAELINSNVSLGDQKTKFEKGHIEISNSLGLVTMERDTLTNENRTLRVDIDKIKGQLVEKDRSLIETRTNLEGLQNKMETLQVEKEASLRPMKDLYEHAIKNLEIKISELTKANSYLENELRKTNNNILKKKPWLNQEQRGNIIDIFPIDTKWKIDYENVLSDDDEIFTIKDDYMIFEDGRKFKIKDFLYDRSTNKVDFDLIGVKNNPTASTISLTVIEEGRLLSGKHDDYNVTIKRRFL